MAIQSRASGITANGRAVYVALALPYSGKVPEHHRDFREAEVALRFEEKYPGVRVRNIRFISYAEDGETR